jgi:hypothetical protein
LLTRQHNMNLTRFYNSASAQAAAATAAARRAARAIYGPGVPEF